MVGEVDIVFEVDLVAEGYGNGCSVEGIAWFHDLG